MKIKTIFVLFIVFILAFSIIRIGRAEDDEHEDEREEHEYEHEYEHEEEDDWDFSDDFDDSTQVIVNQENSLPTLDEQQVIVESATIDVPEIDESLYQDDDNDSDGDGISDYEDKYNGQNDLDFQDIDRDGVIDSHDSDLTKNTDMDHDGIDDLYDTKDDRPFLIKFLSFLKLVR